MLSTLPSLSTSLINFRQKVEAFLILPTNQTIPPNTEVTLTDWLAQGDLGLYLSTSGVNLSNGTYTVPVDGTYVVGGIFGFGLGGANSTGDVTAKIVSGGASTIVENKKHMPANIAVSNSITLSRTVKLKKGVILTFVASHNLNVDIEQGSTYWCIFLKEKEGVASSINSNSISPVSKNLTSYARAGVGFSASISSRAIAPINIITLTDWSITPPGGWNSGSFNPTTGVFTAPVRGFYHLTSSVNFSTAGASSSLFDSTSEFTISDIVNPLYTVTGAFTAGESSLQTSSLLLLLNAGQTISLQVQYGPLLPGGISGTTAAKWSMFLHEKI